jgi:hypothetical protein
MASLARRPDGRWRARYRDAAGKEHARHFDRKIDGQQWLDQVTASVVTNTYVDPAAGRVTSRVRRAVALRGRTPRRHPGPG